MESSKLKTFLGVGGFGGIWERHKFFETDPFLGGIFPVEKSRNVVVQTKSRCLPLNSEEEADVSSPIVGRFLENHVSGRNGWFVLALG